MLVIAVRTIIGYLRPNLVSEHSEHFQDLEINTEKKTFNKIPPNTGKILYF